MAIQNKSGLVYYNAMDASTNNACLTETTLCVVQGDDETFNLAFTQGDDETALDLTGATIDFEVVKSRTDTDEPLIEKQITDIANPTEGKVDLELTHTDTDHPLATYYYKMKLTDQAGKVKTIMKGAFVVEWAK